jgi:hypothetical protein
VSISKANPCVTHKQQESTENISPVGPPLEAAMSILNVGPFFAKNNCFKGINENEGDCNQ